MQHARIKSLILKNCNIGYLGIEELESSLRRNQFNALEVLNMKMNPSIGSNIARLGQQLQFKTLPALQVLNLSDCNLNMQGGIVMSRVFSGMTGLKKLNLDFCKIELVSLAGISGKLQGGGLRCLTGLKVLELAGNGLVLDGGNVSYTGATKNEFFEDLALLTCLENLNLENCRLRAEGVQMFAKQCLCKLTLLTHLNISVNGLMSLSDDEDNLDDCFLDLAAGIRHLKKLTNIKFNQGGFSSFVARRLCEAIASLPRPTYFYDGDDGQKKCKPLTLISKPPFFFKSTNFLRSIQGPISIDVNHCAPEPPLTELKNSNLPWLLWWDDGNADKWQYWYRNPNHSQLSNNKLGTQLMNVVEAMQGVDCNAYVYHHSTMAQWHDALEQSGSATYDGQVKHSEFADFHRSKAAEYIACSDMRVSGEQLKAQADRELQLYDDMLTNPKKYSMLDDVHWPLHCGTFRRDNEHFDYKCATLIHQFLIRNSGIQEYFADEIIEHEVIGQGGFGMVRQHRRACSLFSSESFLGQKSDDTAQPLASK